ncbi:MAG: acyloxyacyl hydrolase [Armatimonadetes bacterium]|nr:acyloxyacyl hydrolase [Armatimonadota bacterium]
MPNFRSAWMMLGVGLATGAMADDTALTGPMGRGNWYVGGFLGQSIPILGSDEVRRGGAFSLQYERKDPRMTYRGLSGSFVLEGYLHSTVGGAKGSTEHNRLNTLGFLGMARWRGERDSRGYAPYGAVGWGISFGNRTTVDLDSKVNSTPVIEGGLSYAPPGQEWLFGLRWLHASNAGLKGRNQGLNEVHVFVAKRF